MTKAQITLLHGDCYKLIKNIPDKSVDLVYIDVPYEYHHGGGGYSEISQRLIRRNESIINISNGIDFSILDELCRVMKYIYIYGVAKHRFMTC